MDFKYIGEVILTYFSCMNQIDKHVPISLVSKGKIHLPVTSSFGTNVNHLSILSSFLGVRVILREPLAVYFQWIRIFVRSVRRSPFLSLHPGILPYFHMSYVRINTFTFFSQKTGLQKFFNGLYTNVTTLTETQ